MGGGGGERFTEKLLDLQIGLSCNPNPSAPPINILLALFKPFGRTRVILAQTIAWSGYKHRCSFLFNKCIESLLKEGKPAFQE